MGDPKFSRRKYETPSHPWKSDRIKKENELLKKYGLKNKKELWKAESILRNFRRQAKNLQARLRFKEPQAVKESELLLKRLASLGMLPEENVTLDDILSLTIESVLARRLQTLIYMRGLARTQSQARQFIVHGHIWLNNRKFTVPGYLVRKHEEDTIRFNPKSPLSDESHPVVPKKEE